MIVPRILFFIELSSFDCSPLISSTIPPATLPMQLRCDDVLPPIAASIAGGVEHDFSLVQKRGVLHDISANVASLFQPRRAGAPEMNTHEHS